MKNIITLILLFTSLSCFSNNGRYRIILTTDPTTTITIGWDQISGTNPVVFYDTTDHGTNHNLYSFSKTVDRSVTARGMENKFARLTGLTPDTAYYFLIRDSQGNSERFWFKTAPDDLSRLSFIAGGDSRNNRVPRQNANLLVSKLKPHAVLFGGDMTDDNTATQWQDWFDDWQLTTANDGRMFPIIPARGNHENSTAIFDLFDTPTSDSYYALTFGDNLIRAYTLNSEISVSGNQLTWLENDLSANTAAIWKSAQYHKPMRPHESGKSEGTAEYDAWAQLFYDEGVRLVVDCDSHTVKTTWPVEPSSDPGNDEGFIRNDNNGTVYAGEGCWGAPLRSNDDNKSWTRDSDSFNQFKLIFIEQSKIELRTIRINNASSVGEVSNNDPFTLPANLDVWNPSNGDVVTILQAIDAPVICFEEETPTNYTSGTNITLDITVQNEGQGITDVAFFVNGSQIAVDTAAPYSFTHTYPDGFHTVEAIATDSSLNTGNALLNISTGNITDITNTISIINGDDDVEEGEDGDPSFTSSDLEMANDGENQVVGLRFLDLQIPEGAIINNAYIQFTSDETDSDPAALLINVEDNSNPDDFLDELNDVTGRTTFTNPILWEPPAWTSAGQAGTAQRTSNLKTLLQQLINREDWTSGSASVFTIEGTGVSLTDPDAKRVAESYNGTPSAAPQLVYSYSIDQDAVLDPVDIAFDANIPTIYANGSNISLEIDIIGQGYGINKVEFFINGNLAFTDTTAPYSINNSYVDGLHTITAVATDNSLRTSTDIIDITVGGFDFSDSVRIANSEDDVEEGEDGEVAFNSSDLEMVYDSFDANGYQTVGLRFREIPIPYGATITDAYIQFRSDEDNNIPAELRITAENTGNSKPFIDQTNNVTNRSRLNAFVDWNPPAWTASGLSGTAQQTSDISVLLQAIIDRCDWNLGNSASFFINGINTSLSNTSAKRVGDSYDGSISNAPQLVFTYSFESSTATSNRTNYEGGSWSNGVPTPSKQAIIKSSYDTSNGNIDACSCEIEEEQTLTVRSGQYVSTQENIIIEGNLIVENGGSIVQLGEDAIAINTGSINIIRNTPSLDPRDFILLSSPLSNETRNQVHTNADRVFEIIPSLFTPDPNPAITGLNFLDENGDYFSPATQLNVGQGYLVFPQAVNASEPIEYIHTYTQGTLNNGTITFPIVYNGSTENNFNLLGNPYASAIDTDLLISSNSAINEVYFWEHITPPDASLPGFNTQNFSMDDISIRNIIGGIPASNGGIPPGQYMASGQGFAILAQQSAEEPGLTFSNTMRVTGNNLSLRTPNIINKLWLRLESETYDLSSATLIGFIPNAATPAFDPGYDSERLNTTINIFSTIENEQQLAIQGREAFDTSMQINMGFATQIEEEEIYTISIDQFEGAELESSSIFLIDNATNNITNLKETAYEFTAVASTQTERFTVVFDDQVLTANLLDRTIVDIRLFPNPTQGNITLSYNGLQILEDAIITDINGKQVMHIDLTGTVLQRNIDISHFPAGMYFIQVRDVDNTFKIVKKIIVSQ